MSLVKLYSKADSQSLGGEVDIIAIHGLNPRSKNAKDHSWGTWQRVTDAGERLWLRDDLPDSLPDAHIFLYEWNATVAYGTDRSSFIDKANELLEAIWVQREPNNPRPIIFLGHSLGGLLIKQALVNAHHNPKYTQIRDATTGIAFFGTPHKGGNPSRVGLGSILEKLARATHLQKGEEFLDVLKGDSIATESMHTQWLQQCSKYNIVSFWGSEDKQVSKDSAIMKLPGDIEKPVKLKAGHGGLCRFGRTQEDEDNLKLVKSNIMALYKKALSSGGPKSSLPTPSPSSTKISNDVGENSLGKSSTKVHTKHEQPAEKTDREKSEEELLQRLYKCHYRDCKDRNPEHLPGTCEWFTKHSHYQDWLSRDSGLLWVSADPGCGKSVLAKHLVDNLLPSSDERLMCYFFFKDDFVDQRTSTAAFCCILRQLFLQEPTLLTDSILETYKRDGELLLNSFSDLWQMFTDVARKSHYKKVVCIIDALDECEESDRRELVKALCKLFDTGEANLPIKFLLTSRGYNQIQRDFRILENRWPTIHLSGESQKEADNISAEINFVIKSKLDSLSPRLKLTEDEVKVLQEELTKNPNRTYLWVHLVFDVINESINLTEDNLRKTVRELPKTVEAVYEKILSRSRDRVKAKKLLQIVVAARRPLKLSEMAMAMAVRTEHKSCYDIKPEPEIRFRETVRELCGLFVTIVDSRIYLLHQTAREFLINDEPLETLPGTEPGASSLEWCSSLCLRDSHRLIAIICMTYLLCVEFDANVADCDNEFCFPEDVQNPNFNFITYKDSREQWVVVKSKPPLAAATVFFDYSASHWQDHLRSTQPGHWADLFAFVHNLCDTKHRKVWILSSELDLYTLFGKLAGLIIATESFGPDVGKQLLLKLKPVSLDSAGITLVRPLISAIYRGYENTIPLLIELGARIDLTSWAGSDALTWAVSRNRIGISSYVLRNGADINARNRQGETALIYAFKHGYIEYVELLLQEGADIHARDNDGNTALMHSMNSKNLELIRFLLQKGADIHARDNDGNTALMHSTNSKNLEHTRLLLQEGADIHARDNNGNTALMHSTKSKNLEHTRLLLQEGADIHTRDNDGNTALMHSTKSKDLEHIRLILQEGADIHARDNQGSTALHHAIIHGNKEHVELLIQKGADVNTANKLGTTPLMHASAGSFGNIIKVLLKNGASVDAADLEGCTALMYATRAGTDACKLLLDGGANSNALDKRKVSALVHAVVQRNAEVVKFLMDKGVKPFDKNSLNYSIHALKLELYNSIRLISDRKDDTHSLLEEGLGRLEPGVQAGYRELVDLWAYLESEGEGKKQGEPASTPHTLSSTLNQLLLLACSKDNHAAVRVLIDQGADIEASRNTALQLAVRDGRYKTIRFLLDPLTEFKDPGYHLYKLAVGGNFPHIASMLLKKGGLNILESYVNPSMKDIYEAVLRTGEEELLKPFNFQSFSPTLARVRADGGWVYLKRTGAHTKWKIPS